MRVCTNARSGAALVLDALTTDHPFRQTADMTASPPRAPPDVRRLLEHATRRAVEDLERQHSPVEPSQLARRLIDAHRHLTAVRAFQDELRDGLEDFVRDLRARDEDLR